MYFRNRKRSEIVSSNSQATNQEPETDGVTEDSAQPECDHSDSSNVDDGPGTRRDAVEEVDGVPPNESCNSLGAMETDNTQLLSHDNKEEVQVKHRRTRLRENVLNVFHQLRNSVKNLINLLRYHVSNVYCLYDRIGVVQCTYPICCCCFFACMCSLKVYAFYHVVF